MNGWLRIGVAGVIGAIALVALGDRGLTQSPGGGGQDPLEILNLQVRSNAIILLDSSGSMRELPDADYAAATSPGLQEGELAGDDARTKLAQAKSVLRAVIAANETKVSFQFGRYIQANSYGPEGASSTTPNESGPYLYTATCLTTDVACNADANNIQIGGTGIMFRNTSMRYTSNGTIIHSLLATQFFNGERYTVRRDGSNFVLVSNAADTNPPWVEVQTRNSTNPFALQGNNVRFMYSGVRWTKGNTSASCGGFESLVGLAPCTQNFQLGTIGPHLDAEVKLDPSSGNPIAPLTTMQGIRASGFTPIAESLIDIKALFNGYWSGSISALNPKPRTFVIVLTDGDDSCTGPSTSDNSAAGAQGRALRAAYQAQLLRTEILANEPASAVTTFVVAFGTGLAVDRSDWVAWGGSGMNQTGISCGPSAPLQPCIPIVGGAWSRIPTPAERAACTTCQDAFVVTDIDELNRALQTAIDQGQSAGEFSDQQSITESIFELTGNVAQAPSPAPPSIPTSPTGRYSVSLPVLLQSTFVMPGFEGHLKAFRNSGGVATPVWDAATKLNARVAAIPANRTFEQLCGAGPAAANPAAGTACMTPVQLQSPTYVSAPLTNMIKRRIYTTTSNGVFLTGTDDTIVANLTLPTSSFVPTGQVALWPTDPAIDPPVGTAGPLDAAMGLTQVAPQTIQEKFDQLQKDFGACTASVNLNMPAQCPTAIPPIPAATLANLQFAQKEARQIILAYTAGANLAKVAGKALRTTLTPPYRLQFNARPSLMAESTLAASAVVTPPLQTQPSKYNAEYKLFRDGPRDATDVAVPGGAGLRMGFGLRNPDLDSTPTVSGADSGLKPVMSVIYHGTNHMLHAFRAGPMATTGVPPTVSCTVSASNECGGEELWAFVPFDQLSKLGERVRPQSRDPHTYVVAAPIRVTDIFVPGLLSRTVGTVGLTGTGVWRTVILFGRGIAGKYLTALDITAPGRFNELSLSTSPPIAMWSRGNPDTQSGNPLGTDYNNTVTGAGLADFTAYSRMGQTWSTPAITAVTAASNITNRRPSGVEFVAFTGSGYSSVTTEGTTIYTLDMQNGDVVRSADIGDRTSPLSALDQNALAAPAAAFNPSLLVAGTAIGNPAASKSTRVYIPDVHGRIWRVLTDSSAAPIMFADAGANQPFGNAVALVNYAGTGPAAKPHIFAESGNDNRIFPPPANTPPFKMFALRDDDLATEPPQTPNNVTGPAFELFTIDFPNGFRGTVQPATAYSPNGSARVFFAGTRFNPTNTPNAPPSTPTAPCRSSFDSVLFAVGAETGGAVYDLNSGAADDRSIQLSGQRIQAVRVSGGRLVVDTGLNANTAPPPPAPPTINPPSQAPQSNVLMGPPLNPDGTPRIPGLVTYKVNSAVCR